MKEVEKAWRMGEEKTRRKRKKESWEKR